MNMRWQIQKLPEAGKLVLLSGAITEESDFRPLTQMAGPEPLCLDLGGIDQINSCGVREWIHFVTHLTRAAQSFELVRCSPAIVRQLNMISNFRGGGKVRSVLLPYICASCNHEDLLPLVLPVAGPPPSIEEVLTCPTCGGDLEFDDLPSSYVAFAA